MTRKFYCSHCGEMTPHRCYRTGEVCLVCEKVRKIVPEPEQLDIFERGEDEETPSA